MAGRMVMVPTPPLLRQPLATCSTITKENLSVQKTAMYLDGNVTQQFLEGQISGERENVWVLNGKKEMFIFLKPQ